MRRNLKLGEEVEGVRSKVRMFNGVVEVEGVYCDDCGMLGCQGVVAVRVHLGVVLTQRVLLNMKW